jgi:hypothetical protein
MLRMSNFVPDKVVLVSSLRLGLRPILRMSKNIPDIFVEPGRGSHPYLGDQQVQKKP